MTKRTDDRQEAAPSDTTARANGKRRKLLAMVFGAFLVGGGLYGAYWALVGRFVESTDDAYVEGNVVEITPQMEGTVVAIHADDTDVVHAGDVLVQLDRADAGVALAHAEAQLGQTVREVRDLFARTAQLTAVVAGREVDLRKAKVDLARREKLARSGAIAVEDLQHARDNVHSAEAALEAAREQLSSNRAFTDNTTVATHPRVAQAAAAVRAAYLDVQRTSLPAPVSGIVAKRSVQLGQRVSPGKALMAVVPLNDVWVEANFKEGQLRHIRRGQPVTLTADANGVEYHGRVVGMAAGTGAAFALLPPQNATGNWIKVVQRLPVRIALEPKELAEHPLQIGLSMRVDVDVHPGSASPENVKRSPGAVSRTGVFEDQERRVDALIADIIARNGGDSVPAVGSALAGQPASASISPLDGRR